MCVGKSLKNDLRILLFDESIAALDAMTCQIMQEELLRIVHKPKKIVIFIACSIDEALILSDRLVVMSARPGQVRLVYHDDLPRPCKPDL